MNLKLVIEKDTLSKAGQMAIGMIKSRTYQGLGADGRPFDPYSTRPFAMPYGAFLQYNTKASQKRFFGKKAGNDYQIFRSKRTGSIWIVIKGGYLALKRSRFLSGTTKVNLSVRGNRGGMLGGLQIVKQDSDSVTIGFSNPEFAQLAYYHNVSGAGKRRVIRRFMGLTPDERSEIIAMIKKSIRVEV